MDAGGPAPATPTGIMREEVMEDHVQERPAKRPVCGATRPSGEPCQTHFGLCEDCGKCFAHCQHRGVQRRAARSRGGNRSAAARREVEKSGPRTLRVVHPDQLPGELPRTTAECVEWLAWLTRATLTGVVDARTSKEATLALKALMDGRKTLDRTDERLKELEAIYSRLTKEQKKR